MIKKKKTMGSKNLWGTLSLVHMPTWLGSAPILAQTGYVDIGLVLYSQSVPLHFPWGSAVQK